VPPSDPETEATLYEDLDRHMEEAGLDWIVARGTPRRSADVFYLLQGARVGHTTVLKKRGEAPLAIVGAMERDEARRAGLRYRVPGDYQAHEIQKKGLPPIESAACLLGRILDRSEVQGRVLFTGEGQIAHEVPLLRRILAKRPAIDAIELRDQSVLGRARETKSAQEIAQIRAIGQKTEEVVSGILRFLRGLRSDGATLCHLDRRPLKIGEVKDRIRLELARRSLDDHGETIFAAGREAGFPHSRGDEALPVPVGKPIIFDIFPQEKGGGYWYDMTRTYWVGAVPDRTREVFDAVRAAFEATREAAKPGAKGYDLDDLACDVLEKRGHVTKRSQPGTETGYLHSLGHGVGLDIHERPSLSRREGNTDRLSCGSVFTIEPGLYYPEEGIGVRLEDTAWITESGVTESLTTLPLDPEIQLDTP